jgi:hypothetical protein
MLEPLFQREDEGMRTEGYERKLSLYDQMRQGPSQGAHQDAASFYSIAQMKTNIHNLLHEIYPKVNEYLTGRDDPAQRALSLETLAKFKVGSGTEKFYDQDTAKMGSARRCLLSYVCTS